MSTLRNQDSSSQTRKGGARAANDALVGRNVMFRGAVWRVVKANAAREAHGEGWLTLRRALGIEALAKPYELSLAVD